MALKVAKFGGSSLADAGQFTKVAQIVAADPTRRYIVPSAPGKRYDNDTKVTDLLYACYDAARTGGDVDAVFSRVTARYTDIIEGLGLDLDLSEEFAQIKGAFRSTSMTFLNSSALMSHIGILLIMPALLTKISIMPISASIFFTNAPTAFSSVTSQTKPYALIPFSL